MNMAIDNAQHQIQEVFCGKVCWGVSAGSPRGSQFRLNLGGKIQSGRIVPVVIGQDDPTEFKGEYRILVSSEWELHQNGMFVADWTDENSIDGPLVRGLNRMVRETLLVITFVEKGVVLDFSSGYSLTCSMDSEEDEDYHAIIFFRPGGSYGLSKNGTITFTSA